MKLQDILATKSDNGVDPFAPQVKSHGFTACSGECCVCIHGDTGCLTKEKEDNFTVADKETIIARLDNGRFMGMDEVKTMRKTLMEKYGYDYPCERIMYLEILERTTGITFS